MILFIFMPHWYISKLYISLVSFQTFRWNTTFLTQALYCLRFLFQPFRPRPLHTSEEAFLTQVFVKELRCFAFSCLYYNHTSIKMSIKDLLVQMVFTIVYLEKSQPQGTLVPLVLKVLQSSIITLLPNHFIFGLCF